MIENLLNSVNWENSISEELPPPFASDHSTRQLRFTLHSESLSAATGIDAEAVDVLKAFANHKRIEVFETNSSAPKSLQIGRIDPKSDSIEVVVKNEENQIVHLTGVRNPDQWYNIARSIYSGNQPTDTQIKSLLNDLILAQAHSAIGSDMLVTLSNNLFNNCDKWFVGKANPCRPLEAVKILGLFLRSKDDFTIGCSKGFASRIDRGLYYWVLTRHRLPRLWKYHSACVYSGKSRHDDTSILGGSILTRCQRALIARDHIGCQFYRKQNNNSRDSTMYHFDYLLLLLSGALDAQAIVASRTYGIVKPKERNTNFRNPEFINALQESGAEGLVRAITDKKSDNLMILLSELRNTIHKANLHTTAYHLSSERQESFVILENGQGEKVWEAASKIMPPEEWGLYRDFKTLLEPLRFATMLIDESFRLVNSIARQTHVESLFSEGMAPKLERLPPRDDVFNRKTRKRVYLLG